MEDTRERLRGGGLEIIAKHAGTLKDAEDLRERVSLKFLEYLTQAGQSKGLGELGGERSRKFQDDLTTAAHSLAVYQQDVSRVRELHRTLRVNLRNYLVHCPLIIRGTALARIDASLDREAEAREILVSQEERDEIFKSEIGRMRRVHEQLDTYLEYAQRVVEGHTAALRSGMDLLRIASERSIGEMSYLHGIEAAGVVAAVVAAVAVDILRDLIKPVLLRFDVIMLAVVGSFFLMRLVSTGRRIKTLWEKCSFAAMVGFLVAGLEEGYWHLDGVLHLFRVGWLRIVLNVTVFLVTVFLMGFVLGFRVRLSRASVITWVDKKVRHRPDGPTA